MIYDLVAFAMPEECHGAGSYYISSLKKLDDFYKEFLHKGHDLLCIAEKKKIILPKEKWSENAEDLFLHNLGGCYEIQGDFGPTHVTGRELMCLKMMINHYSDHAIAAIFEEKLGTVKNSIASFKERTGMNAFDIIILCRSTSFHKGLIH
jgi:hypothetical protein